MPPYVVFHDATLREMAAFKPRSLHALGQISGVGARKLDAYGDAFLAAIRAHWAKRQRTASTKHRGSSARRRSSMFRKLDDSISVAGQISPDDVAAAAAQGFTFVINNRPDGEQPGQPSDAEMRGGGRGGGARLCGDPDQPCGLQRGSGGGDGRGARRRAAARCWPIAARARDRPTSGRWRGWRRGTSRRRCAPRPRRRDTIFRRCCADRAEPDRPMLRVTDLKLPLGHPPEALEAAVRARLGLAADEPIELDDRAAGERCAAQVGDPAGLFGRRDACATRRRCWRASPAIRMCGRRPIPTIASSRARRRGWRHAAGGDRRGAVRAVRRADPRADGVPPDHPRSRQGGARADQGHLGAVAARRARSRNRTCSSARAARAPSPTANCGARSRIRAILGRKVLTEFVKAGAPPEILTEAHPHIGTFRLVTMVESDARDDRGAGRRISLRHSASTISTSTIGGRRHARGCAGCISHDGGYLAADHVVLAVGHSARDTFAMLHERGVHIEAKPFSIGVRIEHPQSWIDRRGSARARGIPISARPPIRCRTTARTGARSTASACAPAGGWWRRHPSRGASSPTA